MKNLKKVPTKQLEKFSNIFMQLGLVLVLFVVYVTLEHKTEDKTVAILKPTEYQFTAPQPTQDFIFQKEVIKVPKLKLVAASTLIIDAPIEKAENNKEETIIDLPEDNPKPLNLDTVTTIEIPEDNNPIEDVPFISIENAPVFKGCEGLSKTENKLCFDRKMKRFIRKNFNAGLANELGLQSGTYKIYTQFLIDAKGDVVDIKIRAPHNTLEKETNRLIKKLPKFTPGKQRNKPVRVRYNLPIAFSVE
ncbi:energy transducer TonB [uncultured Polaribacter sp.]|uniref:energy transducer TonB n=1 Tax=uncultured Polaribacter sp. TaxID=174711 RepID=UPI00263233AD|nr:energy transducer TonB [uncultured Polaribacter sp.]